MLRSYDLSLVICTVAGVALSAYGETDAIGIEWDGDLVQVDTTADGKKIYSRLSDNGATITITLSQKSKSYPLLNALLEAQHGVSIGIHPPVMVPVPFALVDLSTGDNIFGPGVFVKRPAPSKGKTVGEVVFTLHIEDPKCTFGTANLI